MSHIQNILKRFLSMVQDDRTLEAHTSQIAQSDQLVPG